MSHEAQMTQRQNISPLDKKIEHNTCSTFGFDILSPLSDKVLRSFIEKQPVPSVFDHLQQKERLFILHPIRAQ
jgi:hypothetical protein